MVRKRKRKENKNKNKSTSIHITLQGKSHPLDSLPIETLCLFPFKNNGIYHMKNHVWVESWYKYFNITQIVHYHSIPYLIL